MEKSRIGSAVSRFIDLIVAGLYWLICSLPVITIGAASTALYYAVVKCVRHERGRLTGVFFSAFRREFRQSTLTWLLYIGYPAVIALDAYAIGASGHGGGVLGILRWVFFLPALLSLPWMFAYISRFSNNIKGSFKFVGWLTLRNIGRSVILAAVLIAVGVIVYLTPLLLPLLPGAVCMLMSLIIEPVFREYTAEQGDEKTDAWYNE